MRTSPRAQTAIAAALYLAYALWLTWPLVRDPADSIYGLPGGDLTGSIGHWRDVVDGGHFPFAPGEIDALNAPQGLDMPWVLNWASAPGTLIEWLLSVALGSMAGHAVFLWLGFVATGVAMFLLARRVSGSFGVALLCGFALAFMPFAVQKGSDHVVFVHAWPLVLLAWRMLVLAEAPTRRNGLLAGAAAALAMWYTPYFILIGGVEFAALAVGAAIVGWVAGTPGAHVRALLAAGAVVAALLVGLGALSAVAGGEEAGQPQKASRDQIVTYAARAHEYVIPDPDNLLVGDETREFLEKRAHGSNPSESSIYVGLSVVLLALAGVLLLARALYRARAGALRSPGVIAAAGGLLLVATGVAFSAPPNVRVLGVEIPMPSDAIFQLTTTWRVYSRFVLLVGLGLGLLMAFALGRALARRPAPVTAAAVAVLAIVLVLDLWARPDSAQRVTKLFPYEPYAALARQGGQGIVADYPVRRADFPNSVPITYRGFYDKPLLQGYAEGSEDESAKLELGDPRDRDTARDLAALGVRWVILHRGEDPYVDLTGLGYRRVMEDDYGALWEVTARPSSVRVDGVAGFDALEGAPNAQHRWAVANGAELLVTGSCRPCAGALSFRSSSHAVPRRLTVTDGRGRVLARVTVPPSPMTATVRVPQRFQGEARLRLSSDPPPAQVGGDPRTLGFTVIEPSLELGG